MKFGSRTQEVRTSLTIHSGKTSLTADLVVPEHASGLVIFAHGSASSRFSPRNQFVASALNSKGLGSLLVDLLSQVEEHHDTASGEHRFDIDFLSERLVAVIDAMVVDENTKGLKIGLFGASTGAAAALVAAERRSKFVSAVVSRGGRVDLAADVFEDVHAPTLLIVGANDQDVLKLNQEAVLLLACAKHLAVIDGAAHLFEEPGSLEQVAHLAQDWFAKYLK